MEFFEKLQFWLVTQISAPDAPVDSAHYPVYVMSFTMIVLVAGFLGYLLKSNAAERESRKAIADVCHQQHRESLETVRGCVDKMTVSLDKNTEAHVRTVDALDRNERVLAAIEDNWNSHSRSRGA